MMLNATIEIIDDTSFYYMMRGVVLREEPFAVLIEIPFTHETQNVWFFKDQIQIFN